MRPVLHREAVLQFLLGRSGVFADEQAEVRSPAAPHDDKRHDIARYSSPHDAGVELGLQVGDSACRLQMSGSPRGLLTSTVCLLQHRYLNQLREGGGAFEHLQSLRDVFAVHLVPGAVDTAAADAGSRAAPRYVCPVTELPCTSYPFAALPACGHAFSSRAIAQVCSSPPALASLRLTVSDPDSSMRMTEMEKMADRDTCMGACPGLVPLLCASASTMMW